MLPPLPSLLLPLFLSLNQFIRQVISLHSVQINTQHKAALMSIYCNKKSTGVCPLKPVLAYVYVFKDKVTSGVFDCRLKIEIKNLTQTLVFKRGNKT